MNSLSTVDQANLDQYLEIIKRFDPELYLVRIALMEAAINPMVLIPIIRALANLTVGTGYGKVQIFVQSKVVTQVKGEESIEVNEKVVIE